MKLEIKIQRQPFSSPGHPFFFGSLFESYPVQASVDPVQEADLVGDRNRYLAAEIETAIATKQALEPIEVSPPSPVDSFYQAASKPGAGAGKASDQVSPIGFS